MGYDWLGLNFEYFPRGFGWCGVQIQQSLGGITIGKPDIPGSPQERQFAI